MVVVVLKDNSRGEDLHESGRNSQVKPVAQDVNSSIINDDEAAKDKNDGKDKDNKQIIKYSKTVDDIGQSTIGEIDRKST